jgi:two-component system nitrogen regulation sensor histidine kinase NtrY
MKEGKLKITPFILTLALIIIAMAAEWLYLGDFEYRIRTGRFNRVLREKEKIMENCLNGIRPLLAAGDTLVTVPEMGLFNTARQNRITILEYMGDKLTYWSDTDFDVPVILEDSIYTKSFIFLQNGWFLTKSLQSGNETIIGLLRIRSDHGFENDIIRNGFVKDFGMPDGTGFSRSKDASDYQVYSSDGTFLFSLIYPDVKVKSYFIMIPLILWVIAFYFLIRLTFCINDYLVARGRRMTAAIICFLILSAVYLLILFARKPSVLLQAELFSPYRYTMNALVPSLGHLFVLSILLPVLSYILFINHKQAERLRLTERPGYILITLLYIPGALLISLYHEVFSHLIFNSNINFETYKVLDLDLFSLTAFITLLLLFSVPFLYILRVVQMLKGRDNKVVIPAAFSAAIVFPAFFAKDLASLAAVVLFWLLLTVISCLLKNKEVGLFNKTLISSLVLGLYFLFLVTYFSEKKTGENIKIQLVTYSTENDPTAEHLLLDMWPGISSDTILRNMMDVVYFEKDDFEKISEHLFTRYFNAYWSNFNVNIVLCDQNDSLSVGDRNRYFTNCFYFFGRKILASGHQLTGTGFYFIDNRQGRSNYLGRIYYELDDSRTHGLFIDLYSDIKVFQPGYSELLLDRKYHSYARLKDYSFAKYINGEIVLSTGDYPYNKSDAGYIENVVDYGFFKVDSWDHALYRNGNVTVMISRPALTFRDIIISFAYLFAFIFIFLNLMLLFIRRPFFKRPSGLNFRQKMQLSFISILLFSFILIGIVIVSLAINQYQERHYDTIKEKLNSIDTELENFISDGKVLASDWRNSSNIDLEAVLVRLSNIFNTDINLFDPDGFLIATSRPEIYYRNLIARRMDNMASINLVDLKRSEYFQREKIGNLEYISAYVPFYNDERELVAFLNLPYFRMQSVMAREISNMIVAVINFTLLLIVITMGLAVFISGRLTSPLALLSGRLASVELGKKSEHLSYRGNDEVGELVRQYNRMVDELDESARKLANSEREYAWREMAKQIAHEIKNPLTPMKLNIQQLFKSWTDRVPGFEKKLERFTKNQIEYIDNLSSIASAFSSFAKIPDANPVAVDLLEQVKTTFELFKNSDNISFRIGCQHDEKIIIYADKEQINSILSNLIKNGIQSVPPGREGIIKVTIEKNNDKVVVSVSDNGTGIPESLRSKMFTPNFTTKSSGTGLGLSIAKRYVENAGGRIWFESETNKGSVFFMEFPLMR